MTGGLAEQRRAAIRREFARRGSVRTADLAERLGVSERTVQRDLDWLADQLPTGRRVYGGLVSAEPGTAAPGLRIGLLLPVGDHYYEEVIAGAEAAAAALNVRLVVGTYAYREDLETAALHRLGEVRLDGLVATVDYRGHGYHQLRALGLTTVVIERPWHPDRFSSEVADSDQIDHVCSDHHAGAGIGLRHLAGLGHRSVLCLVRGTATAVPLLRGLEHGAAELGPSCPVEMHAVPVDPETLEPLPEVWQPLLADVIERCRTGAVTAIFAHADWEAQELHRRLATAGIAVPDRVSLLAYDGVRIDPDPVLSAVTPRRRWIGAMAVETVVDRLRSRGRRSHEQRPGYQVSLVPELILRSSTAPSPCA
ncbi:substrate-binding domain-containing protein [Microlunatus sp. GCM10028923]|uniref:substrate-binding domain-containing protein n=1 Tax=Microlunatus sp. GCM10028923 TaxID=3273400 RepID=UPI0036091222